MQKWFQEYLFLSLCIFDLKFSSSLQLWEISASPKDTFIRGLQSEGLLDVWSGQGRITKAIVENENAEEIKRRLGDAQLENQVLEEDLLALVDEEKNFLEEKRSRTKRSIERMDWSSYHKLEDIEGYLGWMNATNYGRVSVLPVASTDENRNVYVVRVADPNTPGPKVKIWIEGGIHAREWISPAATTFLIHQVATNPEFGPILAKSEWYFVPVANPDGYEYSFNGRRARMWRKNRSASENRFFPRQIFGGSACRGVDLNRNWDLKWGVGASSNMCSDTYKGTKPFSEPETLGLKQAMEAVAPIDLFITLHSYGQSVLYPWGWTTKAPKNVNNLIKLGRRYVDSVKHASHGKTKYSLDGSGKAYGLASGASDDWAYGAIHSPYSYTIELRDTGKHGFLLPENQIMDTVHETSVGIYCMASYLTKEGRCSSQRRADPVEPRRYNPSRRRRNRRINFAN